MKKNIVTKMLAVVVTVAMLGGLTACGSSSKEPSSHKRNHNKGHTVLKMRNHHSGISGCLIGSCRIPCGSLFSFCLCGFSCCRSGTGSGFLR